MQTCLSVWYYYLHAEMCVKNLLGRFSILKQRCFFSSSTYIEKSCLIVSRARRMVKTTDSQVWAKKLKDIGVAKETFDLSKMYSAFIRASRCITCVKKTKR